MHRGCLSPSSPIGPMATYGRGLVERRLRRLGLLWRPLCRGEEAPPAGSEALWRKLRAGGAAVVPGFLSEAEEALLAEEVEPPLRRRRYEDAHWDGAIHKYRETEKLHWSKESQEILQRVRDAAFPPGVPQLAQVHVLDLHKAGYIKPHLDSVKFCGCTIAGLSLLSSSVMRLVSEQNPEDCLDLLLERRSLYILRPQYPESWLQQRVALCLKVETSVSSAVQEKNIGQCINPRGPARYEFTHEILKDEDSFFDGRKITRERRISVICRNLPVLSDPS